MVKNKDKQTKPCKHGYRNFCPVPDCDHGKLGSISAGPAPDLSVYVHSPLDVEKLWEERKEIHNPPLTAEAEKRLRDEFNEAYFGNGAIKPGHRCVDARKAETACAPLDPICSAHVSHPCEKCGKLSGQAVFIFTQSQLYKLLIEQSGLTYENCVQHGYEVEHAGHSAANDTIEGLQAERELVYNGEMKAMTSQLDLLDILSRRYHEGLLDASKIVDFLKQAITEISTPEQAQAITERFRDIERAARNAKE